jgi:hypothetical protein
MMRNPSWTTFGSPSAPLVSRKVRDVRRIARGCPHRRHHDDGPDGRRVRHLWQCDHAGPAEDGRPDLRRGVPIDRPCDHQPRVHGDVLSERWHSVLWPRCSTSPAMDVQRCHGSHQHLSCTFSSSSSPSGSVCRATTRSRPPVTSSESRIRTVCGSDLTRPDGSAGTTYGRSPLPSRSACSPGRSSSLEGALDRLRLCGRLVEGSASTRAAACQSGGPIRRT